MAHKWHTTGPRQRACLRCGVRQTLRLMSNLAGTIVRRRWLPAAPYCDADPKRHDTMLDWNPRIPHKPK